ncbi:SDR family oxidoreductase [Alphaproteobacteria bacterium]|nr:SDR family oxidoreductase [Alphaproteobacteria bacterium]
MSGMRLSGKTALVTGSGQGIGEAIAKVFAAEGAEVVVATRTQSSGQYTVDDIIQAGGKAILVTTDVQDDGQISNAIDATIKTYCKLDIMVHNAASFAGGPIEEYDPLQFDDAIRTNLKAAFSLAKASIPHMKKLGRGRLLYTSSVTGPRVAMPGAAYYAASKGGLNAFIKTAGLELASLNITVNGVEPGFIKTPAMDHLTDQAGQEKMAKYIPAGRIGEPEDIAYAMLYLASDEASYVTGQTIIVDGGSTIPESPLFFDEETAGMKRLADDPQ